LEFKKFELINIDDLDPPVSQSDFQSKAKLLLAIKEQCIHPKKEKKD
jgi:hypothetical protein